MNMCDGCNACLPLIGGIHVDKDGNFIMVCQKDRYVNSKRGVHEALRSSSLKGIFQLYCKEPVA